jgi:hypothetical protein
MFTRTDVSPLQPTLTFHSAFGSAFITPRPVAAVRAMVTATGPVHHFSLVKWENRISRCTTKTPATWSSPEVGRDRHSRGHGGGSTACTARSSRGARSW